MQFIIIALMGYLILTDYQRVIQTSELNAITTNTDSLRQLVESSVLSELNSRLIQRFDTVQEFTNLVPFNPAVSTPPNSRVYLTASAYVPANIYTAGQLTLYTDGNVYSSIAGNGAEAFNPSHWTLLGPQFTIFYMSTPYPMFSVDSWYKPGSIVYWKGLIYIAISGSNPVDQQTELLSPKIEAVDFGNIVPGSYMASSVWGNGVPYTPPTSLLPTNPLYAAYSGITTYAINATVSYNTVNYVCTGANGGPNPAIIPGTNPQFWAPVTWNIGDNRNQQLVEIFMDMVVYKLCKRIAPNNVPEARHNAWLKAAKDIEKFADGKVNAQIAILQPKQGNRIQSGGWPQMDFSGGF